MIQFNELYVSSDGKHLVVDAEIEDFAIYDSCYIDTVVVDTAEDYCSGGKAKAVTVYQNGGSVIQNDMNGDGKITDIDCALYNRLLELIAKLKDDDEEEYDQHDVNRDGIVDLKDYDALRTAITGTLVDEYRYDVNGDGEAPNNGDLTDMADYLLSMGMKSLSPDEYAEFAELFQAYQNDKLETTKPERHLRLCLNWCDLVGLVGVNGNFANQIFVVTVTASCDGSIGSTAKDLGCGWDNNTITGVAFNGKPIYDAAVRYASAYGNACDSASASAFEDFVLRYYAFDFALRAGDVCQAWYYYNNYLNGGNQAAVPSSHGCGCHGTY